MGSLIVNYHNINTSFLFIMLQTFGFTIKAAFLIGVLQCVTGMGNTVYHVSLTHNAQNASWEEGLWGAISLLNTVCSCCGDDGCGIRCEETGGENESLKVFESFTLDRICQAFRSAATYGRNDLRFSDQTCLLAPVGTRFHEFVPITDMPRVHKYVHRIYHNDGGCRCGQHDSKWRCTQPLREPLYENKCMALRDQALAREAEVGSTFDEELHELKTRITTLRIEDYWNFWKTHKAGQDVYSKPPKSVVVGYHEGDIVEGYYLKDKTWYGATVGPESHPTGPSKVHLLWDDGAKGFVEAEYVRLKSTEDNKSGLSDDDIDRRLLNLVAPDEMFPAVPTPILDNLKAQKHAEQKKLVTFKADIQYLVRLGAKLKLQTNTIEANIKRLDGQILSEADKCNQIDADEWLKTVNPKCPQCGVRRNDFFDEAKEEAMLPEGQTFKDLEEKCPRCKQPWAWVEELPDTPKSQSPTELSTAELELMISKM